MITFQLVGSTTNETMSSSKDKFLFGYYLFMLGVFLLLTHPNASYNILFRFAYLGMLVVPLLFNPRFVPFVISCFYGTSMNACYSLLPESFEFCIAIILVLFILHWKSMNFSYGEIKFLLAFFVYSLLISIVNYDIQQNFIQIGFVVILLYPFMKKEDDVQLLAIGICLMTLALAIMFFRFFYYYSFSVGINDEFERGSWQNLNMLAGAIACGLPLSLALLLNEIKGWQTKLFKGLLIVYAIFILFTLVMISSRGALIAAVSSSILLISFSKIKVWIKFIVFAAIIILIFLMFNHHFFDLFIYRLFDESTTDTAGGRIVIWQNKLNPFFNDSVLTQLFGMGRDNCSYYGGYKSTHNDFVTAIVGFGFIGFFLMAVFVLAPLFKAIKQNIFVIGSLVLFIVLECFVLEPYYRGYLPFWILYILVLKLAVLQRQEQIV